VETSKKHEQAWYIAYIQRVSLISAVLLPNLDDRSLEMHATSSTPSTSVLSSLHSTLGSLQNAFPSTLTSHLHPFSSTSSDIFAQRERLTKDIATIKRSLESFRQSWTAEKEVVDTERPSLKITEPSGSGQDSRELDSELERRKLGMIRVMMDW
jgi:hypothetical protein